MRWEIESRATGGLQIISSIPGITPCVLEGENGIGKSAAMHLLSLLGARIPEVLQTDLVKWNSFRNNVGQTRITVTELQGASKIEVTFTPDAWPDDAQLVDIEKLGQASIDGRRATMTAVRDLISVDLIAGNESLADTIKQHNTRLGEQLEQIGRVIRGRGEAIDEGAGDLLRTLERLDPSVSATMARDVPQLEAEVSKARVAADGIATRTGKADALSDLLAKLGTLDGEASTLLKEQARALAEVERLTAQREEAKAVADALAGTLEAQGGAVGKLASASKLARTRKSRVARFEQEVADLAGALEVETDHKAVSEAISITDERVVEINRQLGSMDAVGQVRSTLDAIMPSVESIAGRFGDFTLAEGFNPVLTAAAAASAFALRREELANEPTPAQLRKAMDERRGLMDRAQRLRKLNELMASLARAQRNADDTQQEYEELAKQSQDIADLQAESREADQRVGGIETQLASAHGELALISHRIAMQGSISRLDGEKEAQRLKDELGLAEADNLQDVVAGLREELTDADERTATLEKSLADMRRRLAVFTSEISEAIILLEASKWLPNVARQRLRVADGQPDLEGYGAVRAAILDARSSIDAAGDEISRLAGLSKTFFDPTNNGAGALGSYSNELRVPFSKMLSERILAALNSPSIRARVFDGAEAIEIDPISRTLTLVSEDGEEQQRALATFSVGEQAFAFTQARILDLEPREMPNRLLILDEFGAFVSADRLPELASFLRSHEVAVRFEQIVVVLPLQIDYRAEIEDTRGALQAKYASRVEQLDQNRYYVEELR